VVLACGFLSKFDREKEKLEKRKLVLMGEK